VIQAASFLVSRAGKILASVPQRGGPGALTWSPDGRQVATCGAAPGRQSTVSVLTAASGKMPARTITLPGRHDVACDQLLWSPDGSQLIYSAFVTGRGLTSADDLQHGWTVIDLRTGAVHDVTAPGQPAAWLPAS
jgi:WD40 repeat protein